MTEDAEGLSREHVLQVTAQRLAVLEAVSARPHASPDEIDEPEVIYWGRCPSVSQRVGFRPQIEAETGPVSRVLDKSDNSDTKRATSQTHSNQPSKERSGGPRVRQYE